MSLPPARQDGRPLYYDAGGWSQCAVCQKHGTTTVYGPGYHFLSDRANSPFGSKDTAVYVVCIHHAPDNAVIYNPGQDEFRDKSGRTWKEE